MNYRKMSTAELMRAHRKAREKEAKYRRLLNKAISESVNLDDEFQRRMGLDQVSGTLSKWGKLRKPKTRRGKRRYSRRSR